MLLKFQLTLIILLAIFPLKVTIYNCTKEKDYSAMIQLNNQLPRRWFHCISHGLMVCLFFYYYIENREIKLKKEKKEKKKEPQNLSEFNQ